MKIRITVEKMEGYPKTPIKPTFAQIPCRLIV
jgi:hypothetical protein